MDKVKVKPLGDRVILRVDKGKDKSAGGIYIPDTAKEKPQRGEVLAVGPGKMLEDGRRSDMQTKPGDVVLFTRWAGTEVKELDEDILILQEADILGIIEEG